MISDGLFRTKDLIKRKEYNSLVETVKIKVIYFIIYDF